MDVNDIENQILRFWNDNSIFEKSLKKTKNCKPYIFYDGPPFATGNPHYGHLLGSIVKDLFGRFWTMKGRFVNRVWGWDCHGLPIENIAEKSLGINSKDEIEKMGIKKFNDFCRSKVLGYTEEWEKVINRIGRWVDMKNCYKTMDNSYIESIWWAFKTLWEKKYIYEGEKILMYCPRCSTPLSKSEIAMDNSYKIVKDSTVVVKFKLEEQLDGVDVCAIAWTTTPWTLPSNLALTVNSDLIYSYIKDKSDGTVYLLSKSLIKDFWKNESDYDILKDVKGKELEGKKYYPLFDYFKNTPNAFKFLLGDFVSDSDGTGIVHTAPNFGEDDYSVCFKYKIPTINSVDEKGNFTNSVKDFSGEYVHDSNLKIIDFLKSKGLVVLVKKVEHEYPFCYRCDTKLIYKSLPAWFVDIQKIKPKLLELNNKLNWHPDFLKEGRVRYNLETAPDWNITRNRYWASAIPIWKNNDGDNIVVGSIEELKKYAKNLPEKIDLHKDFLDNIILEKDGKEYKRIPEVMDCWFESGAMPFAQFHYPFENKEYFEKHFPAQFVAEYIGQTRAWFYYMNVLSAILFDNIPVENYVTTGTILAEDGQKMSKSKNNYTDPLILIQKYGVDAIRFYLMGSSVMNADNINFSDKGVDEIYKKLVLIMYNISKFYEDYKTNEEIHNLVSINVTDKWILSRLNEVGKNVSKYYEEYNTIKACFEIRVFVEDLSTWYIRLNRDRFNDKDLSAVKILKFVLDRLSKICSPIIPFVSEKMYQSVYGTDESVHLSSWPEFENYSLELLDDMKIVRDVVSSGLKSRDQKQIGLKWPLSCAKVRCSNNISNEMIEIIKQELNVKKVEFSVGDFSVELDYNITKELEIEGFAREISRKIQAGRKTCGLIKTDKIDLYISKDFGKSIESLFDFIIERVGAKNISLVDNFKNMDFVEDGEIKNEKYKFGFRRI